MINQTAVDFSVQGATQVLPPLAVYVLGVVVYSVFIFKFYKFLARKDIFEWTLGNPGEGPFQKFLEFCWYVLQYIIIFPLFVFFWFGVLVAFLTFLAKETTLGSVLLISMALVAAVRITAYYDEDLSKDLAKMLPFALLGVFIVDGSYLTTMGDSIELLKTVPLYLNALVYYLLFVIMLEFILRVSHGVISRIK